MHYSLPNRQVREYISRCTNPLVTGFLHPIGEHKAVYARCWKIYRKTIWLSKLFGRQLIGKVVAAKLLSILEQVNSRPILTISDIKEFADKGGMIELRKVKDGARTNIKLRINAARAEEKNITLGIELLLVADHVDRDDLLIISDRLH